MSMCINRCTGQLVVPLNEMLVESHIAVEHVGSLTGFQPS
jgi:hypothetical protein